MIQNKVYTFLLLIILPLFFSCAKPKEPHYIDFQNFKFDEIGAGQSVIYAELKYYNPNRFMLKLKEGQVDVSVNNTLLGNSKLDTMLVIPKMDTFIIPLQMKVDTKTLMLKALNVILSNEMEIKLDGNAMLGKAGIYFNVPIHYQGKQKIVLFK
jgi:LEA14-like dessication related protein